MLVAVVFQTCPSIPNKLQIRGIQVALEPEEEEDEQTLSSVGYSDILFETSKSLTITDVCKTLGGRASVDKLISTYFNHRHNQTPVLHMKKFMREVVPFIPQSPMFKH